MVKKKGITLDDVKEWNPRQNTVERDSEGNIIPKRINVNGIYNDGTPFAFSIKAKLITLGDLNIWKKIIRDKLGASEEEQKQKAMSEPASAMLAAVEFLKKFVISPDMNGFTTDDMTGKTVAEINAVLSALMVQSGYQAVDLKNSIPMSDISNNVSSSGSYIRSDIGTQGTET